MQKNNLPLVSIIIANRGRTTLLERCLRSIIAKTKVAFEIVVVDAGTKEAKLEELKSKFKKEKRVKIIKLKKDIGPPGKRNKGVEKSRSKYLVFLDSDTIVAKNWLIKVISFLGKDKTVGAGQLKILKTGQKDYFDSAGEKLTQFGFLSERARGVKDQGQFDQVEDIFSGKTAAMIVRKDVFLKAGRFDQDYFMYWEEPDLCWRIWKLGYRVVFLPMGKIWHDYWQENKKISPEKSAQITFLGCRNQISTIVKNGVGFQLFKMLIAVCFSWLILLFPFLIKGEFKKAKAIAKAFLQLTKDVPLLLKKRARAKKRLAERFYSDKNWFNKIRQKRPFSWYLGKATSYLFGKPF